MWQHRNTSLRLFSQHIAKRTRRGFVRNQRLEPEKPPRSGFSGYNVWSEPAQLLVEALDQQLPFAGGGIFAGECAELHAVGSQVGRAPGGGDGGG